MTPAARERILLREEVEQELVPAFAHGFNHRTHPGDHVHALLTGLIGKAPELDLLYCQRLSARSAA